MAYDRINIDSILLKDALWTLKYDRRIGIRILTNDHKTLTNDHSTLTNDKTDDQKTITDDIFEKWDLTQESAKPLYW